MIAQNSITKIESNLPKNCSLHVAGTLNNVEGYNSIPIIYVDCQASNATTVNAMLQMGKTTAPIVEAMIDEPQNTELPDEINQNLLKEASGIIIQRKQEQKKIEAALCKLTDDEKKLLHLQN